MNPNLQMQIAQRVDRYLDDFSIARKLLLVDRIYQNFSKTFKAIDDTFVKTDKDYLLYENKSVNPHVFISKQKDLSIKQKVNNQKHIPTFIVQKNLEKFEDLEEQKLFTKMSLEYLNNENDNIIKLIKIAFAINTLKYSKLNIIKNNSLKASLNEANRLIKNKIDTKETIKYNVLCNLSLNLSDLHDKIEVDDLGYNSYNNNTFITSTDIDPGELYVMPQNDLLGVMPIIEDIIITSDKDKLITSYEIGMSILNIKNIVKIKIPTIKPVILGC